MRVYQLHHLGRRDHFTASGFIWTLALEALPDQLFSPEAWHAGFGINLAEKLDRRPLAVCQPEDSILATDAARESELGANSLL